MPTAECVICGAGIAGIAAAYHLTKLGMREVLLIDAGDPLALTSDKSTEGYRNWWPGPGDAMVALMNRSIDLMEQIADATDNRINLNRRGYLYATADAENLAAFRAATAAPAALGAGELRLHDGSDGPTYQVAPAEGYAGQPGGADLLLDQALIRKHFPYLAPETIAVLHARRAGWFSAQQLGMVMLEEARARGTTLLRGRLSGVDVANGRVEAVRLNGADLPPRISTACLVNAAGPELAAVGRMLGLELPVFAELHIKLAFNDYRAAIPREAPLLIWADPTALPWSPAERTELAADAETRYLLDVFPPGVHCRPDGRADSDVALILWGYHPQVVLPQFPLPLDPDYPDIALRGMAVMLPALREYFGHMPRPVLDGGYYIKTRENRPLIGPLPVGGAYVSGAYSGFGLMSACAAGELLAAHISGSALPSYAAAFDPARYDDPVYLAQLETWGDDGQL
jgi:glycine/D-amino acid oxidase-like deaminating enzyme